VFSKLLPRSDPQASELSAGFVTDTQYVFLECVASGNILCFDLVKTQTDRTSLPESIANIFNGNAIAIEPCRARSSDPRSQGNRVSACRGMRW
jgi:hypothetical protein